MDDLRLYNASTAKTQMDVNLSEDNMDLSEFMDLTMDGLIDMLREFKEIIPEEERDTFTVRNLMEMDLDLDEDPETEEEP